MEDYCIRWILSGLGTLLITFLAASIIIWAIIDSTAEDPKASQAPQSLPYAFPLLKSTIPFLFDGLNLFLKAS